MQKLPVYERKSHTKYYYRVKDFHEQIQNSLKTLSTKTFILFHNRML